MPRISRPYQPGDETFINYLYKLVTGTTRSTKEYTWEWLETWNGPGSVWLVLDDSRSPEDQLIAQYSLIPTPFSFWGKSYLAGKTENCMSHPDYRGKGMYFFHEQTYFEEAKKRFQLFFTTTGDVARGAPGKVRMKLGYRPFDYWVTLSYWLDKQALLAEIDEKLPAFVKKRFWIRRPLKNMMVSGLFCYTKTRNGLDINSVKKYTEDEAPLVEIENLWRENAELYGITVERTAAYLKWRINDNPYATHYYLCYYEGSALKGYLIYVIQDKTIHIIDILAHGKQKDIFKILLEKLKVEGRQQHLAQIKCYTASQNQFLIEMLQSAKLINYTELFDLKKSERKKRPPQLFVYIAEGLESELDMWDNKNWYITDLIKEGRPYTARPIG